jgi:hypothetical protein
MPAERVNGNETVIVIGALVKLDGLDSIRFLVKIRDRIGHLSLSQIYGSYNKIFQRFLLFFKTTQQSLSPLPILSGISHSRPW